MLVDATPRSPRPRQPSKSRGRCGCNRTRDGFCRGLATHDVSLPTDCRPELSLWNPNAYSHRKHLDLPFQVGSQSPAVRGPSWHLRRGIHRSPCRTCDEAGYLLEGRRSSGYHQSYEANLSVRMRPGTITSFFMGSTEDKLTTCQRSPPLHGRPSFVTNKLA